MDAEVAATFCATFADELVRAGVRHACISPGSRSTPMALALAMRAELVVSVHHDERSAGFAALGVGLATGRPAAVLTTSGTAAVELHPAVVEADLAGVPLLALTADRPPELHGVGAAQTANQQDLYGSAVRRFVDLGVPSAAAAATWRSVAARAVLDTLGPRPGPVHVNLPFREPLLGTAGALPPGRDGGRPWHRRVEATPSVDVAVIAALIAGRRGVIVAGHTVDDPVAVAALAARLGWPVLADAQSGCRGEHAITHADALLRSGEWAEAQRPEIVLRFGAPWASRVVNEWLATVPLHIAVHPSDPWSDPDRRAALYVAAPASAVARALDAATQPTAAEWIRAEAAARDALARELTDLNEPYTARAVVERAPAGAAIVVASSMPIRDVEWYAGPREGVAVFANRGANGIDGVISTALGVALTGRPTIALVGDIAFLHDSTALVALARREVDLTIVAIDNDGGGIFSFLGQADALDHDRFEQLFGTPHGTDLAALALAHGLAVAEPRDAAELDAALAVGGARVVVVRSDRRDNVALHRRLHAAIAAAVRGSS